MAHTNVDHGRIALLAYQLWQEQASPVGSSDADWYRAEELLGIHPTMEVTLFALAMGPGET